LSPRSTSKNENLSGVSGMSGELGSGFFRSKFPTVINTCYKLSYLFSAPFLATYVKLNVRLAISDVSGLSEFPNQNHNVPCQSTRYGCSSRAACTQCHSRRRTLSVTHQRNLDAVPQSDDAVCRCDILSLTCQQGLGVIQTRPR